MRTVIIDNYDSFTYNLVQELGELGSELVVVRNDEITISELQQLDIDRVVISPGPGRPSDSGISIDAIQVLGIKKQLPILGVCLGHQCIAEVFGARITHAPYIYHGKTSEIYHNGNALYANIPNPFEATRYHSLVVDKSTVPDCLIIDSETSDGIIMGLSHKDYPIYGVQFHPESVLTKYGKQLLSNFLNT